MNTVLAIYDALLQAGVPDAPARRVVEALEQDMATLLATKQDLVLIRQDFQALRADFMHLEQLTTAKLSSLGERMDLRFQNLELRAQASESRIVIRLSVVMTMLFAAAGALLTMLR
jgi:hypothetical protein